MRGWGPSRRMVAGGAVLALALFGSVATRHWLDRQPRPEIPAVPVSDLSRATSPSFGFQAVRADWDWIRTLHYFGRRAIELGEADVRRMPLLEGLLRRTVTADPRHLAAWRFGAFFLSQIDPQHPEVGLRFIREAIRENPQDWRLVADLAFITWQAGRDREAAQAWQRAASLPGAPAWLGPMAGVVLARGGEIETARSIFRRLIETTSDPFVREVCLIQLERLNAGPPPAQRPGEEPPR
ncbi:MAG: tetratricopeptide repeat protein [Acidobacteriota bacterium]